MKNNTKIINALELQILKHITKGVSAYVISTKDSTMSTAMIPLPDLISALDYFKKQPVK